MAKDLIIKVNYLIEPKDLPVENLCRMLFNKSKERFIQDLKKEFAEREAENASI